MSAQVLTQHNDLLRTGVNASEPTLTRAAVRQGLHRVAQLQIDPPAEGGPGGWGSQVVAQPLVVPNVSLGDGTTKDLLIICSMHGTVYAFDAANDCARIWGAWLGPPVRDLVDATGKIDDAKDIFATTPEWGVLSTPTVDPALRRIYVVMWHNENGGTFRLHALDLATGHPSLLPAVIGGSVADAAGDPVSFNPVMQKQRPGLLLLKASDLSPAHRADVGSQGTIYVAFGASIEASPDYHGWVFAYDAATFGRRAVWCATPNGSGGGVWHAGGGLVADRDGGVYLMTGNGDFDGARHNFGESFVKLAASDLRVLSFFTPWYWKGSERR